MVNMNTVSFPAASPAKKDVNKREIQPDKQPVFSGPNKRELTETSASALQANFMPVLFSGEKRKAKVTEGLLKKALKKLEVPEMLSVLENAKILAAEKGHPQVTALHLLTTQVNAMLGDINPKATLSRQGNTILKQFENPRGLWSANLGIIQKASHPEDILFHLKRVAIKLHETLDNIPAKSPLKVTQVKLSQNVLDLLMEQIQFLKDRRPSDKEMHEVTSREVDANLPPEFEASYGAQENEIEKIGTDLEARFPKHLKALTSYDLQILETYVSFKKLSDAYNQVKLDIESGETQMSEDQKATKETFAITSLSPEGPVQQSVPFNDMPKVLERFKKDFLTLLDQAFLNDSDRVSESEQELDTIPLEAIELMLKLKGVEKKLDQMDEQVETLRLKAEENWRKEIDQGIFSHIITGTYNEFIPSGYLKDTQIAQARSLFLSLINTLVGDHASTSESSSAYLNRIVENGGGDPEIKNLTQMLRMREILLSKVEGSTMPLLPGEPKPLPSLSLLKELKDVTALIKAYSQVDWKDLKNKSVDLKLAKTLLDSNPLIPPPVRSELINFLKQGNKNNWQAQPMLVLMGGYGTGLVKREVIKFLEAILPMNAYEAKGPYDGQLTNTEQGALSKEKELSVPAKALIHSVESARQKGTLPTPSPSTFINLGNLLNFLEEGGFSQFSSLMGTQKRKDFEEPELRGITMDLSPYVFVTSVENEGVLDYLGSHYGGNLNHRDWSLIELGKDIDIFTKIRAAETEIAPAIEAEYNARFAKGAVKTIVTYWAIDARHDEIERILTEAARTAAGKTSSTQTQTIPAEVEILEKEYLGPQTTSFLNKHLTEDTVGSVNALAAFGYGGGAVMRMGIHSAGTFSRKDTGGRLAQMRHAVGPIGTMAKDSSIKATELLSAVVSELTDSGSGKKAMYKVFEDMTQGHELIVNWKENVDGPSAGAAMATATISRLTGIPVRHDVAMTGTLADGLLVGEIGGIFNKISAAYVAGTTSDIKTILMPKANYIEMLKDHPQFVEKLEQAGTKLIGVETLDEVLRHSLVDYQKLHQPAEINTKPDAEVQDPTEKILTVIREANKTSAQSAQAIIPDVVAAVIKQLAEQGILKK